MKAITNNRIIKKKVILLPGGPLAGGGPPAVGGPGLGGPPATGGPKQYK
jgi:hypothetical protein